MSSRVRVVHNVAKGPDVDVSLDGKTVLSGVSYRTVGDYLQVPSGRHSVSISGGGKSLAGAEVDLFPNEDYTVIAHGDVNNLSSIALLKLTDDKSCPRHGTAHLRFVHAAATVPAVDIWAGHSKIFSNVSYGSTGNPVYLPVKAGFPQAAVTPAGSHDAVLGPTTMNLIPGNTYTLIASGLLNDHRAPIDGLIATDSNCHTVHMW